MKPVNQKAWLLVLPVVLCVAFSAVLPLMTVVNYSVQDIISPERRVFVGTDWFKSVMRDHGIPTPDFYAFNETAFKELGAAQALAVIEQRLGFPLVVKPAAQGSAENPEAGKAKAGTTGKTAKHSKKKHNSM